MAKLTHKQVSQLSDIELNRAMIWCYPPHFKIDDHGSFLEPSYHPGIVCYLRDYNLTIPLAHKEGLTIFMPHMDYSDVTKVAGKYAKPVAYNINPLRAICEVLLMIAMKGDV